MRSKLLFILFQVTLKFWRFIFWKTQKCYMMSSCMIKLEFLPEPYMLFKLEKLPHICCLLLHWVLSSFVRPYERFVMLLKSRSRTQHPNIHYSYTGGRRKNMPSSRSTQKCFAPTGEHKNMLDRFFIHQINALSSYCYLSKVLLQERGMGLYKSYS